jgi:diguanylate cyclase (GGDEF)-like protein/PAS domain S-box-containing protein
MSHPENQAPKKSTPFWSRPIFIIASFSLVLVLSAGAIINLQQYSASQYDAAVEADELALTTYHLYTSAWRAALAFQPQTFLPPEVVEQEKLDATALFDLALARYQSEAAELNSSSAREIIVGFASQMEQVHTLIQAGQHDQAFGLMAGSNTTYYPMADAVYFASQEYARNATRAERWATFAIGGVCVVAFAFAVGIFSLYRRASRKVESAVAEHEIVRRSEARFRPLVQSSSDLIAVVDREGKVMYASPAIKRFSGLSPEEVAGTPIANLVAEEDRRAFYGLLSEVKNRPSYTTSAELHLLPRRDSDKEHFIQVVCTNRLSDPDVDGLVLNIRDVSERKELEEQLRHQAFHDSLTGLANRLRFTDRLEHALERGKRNGGKLVSVLYMDLDYFKNVNDDMGHTAGDALLREVADRVRACIRSTDTAARLGGDEFAILLEDHHNADEAGAVANYILEQVKLPFLIGEREVYVSASIGVVVADPHHMSAEEIIRDADVAMYDAKENGRGRVQVFEASMQLSLAERVALSNDLNVSVERGELEVYYQPTLHLDTERIAGFEALVRWNHPTRGLLTPMQFIPLAEESGFIHDLGYFVLYEACRQAKDWQAMYASGGESFAISVNVSARQIQKAGFVQLVEQVLEETGFDAASLILEITETVLIRHPQEVIQTLAELKQLGLHLALDDFGTGYSSLSYLKRFPIDILKIDRAFIEGMDESDRDRMLVQTVIDLGHTLKLDIVAEGIERSTQLESLQKLHCALGQGFLFARALDASSAEAMLRDQSARPTLPSTDEGGTERDVRVA